MRPKTPKGTPNLHKQAPESARGRFVGLGFARVFCSSRSATAQVTSSADGSCLQPSGSEHQLALHARVERRMPACDRAVVSGVGWDAILPSHPLSPSYYSATHDGNSGTAAWNSGHKSRLQTSWKRSSKLAFRSLPRTIHSFPFRPKVWFNPIAKPGFCTTLGRIRAETRTIVKYKRHGAHQGTGYPVEKM